MPILGVRSSGSAKLSTDGNAGSSGIAKRIMSVMIRTNAGGNSVVKFHNGTSTTGAVYLTETATSASRSTTFEYAQGFLFSAGCYVEFDANTSFVVVEYSQQ